MSGTPPPGAMTPSHQAQRTSARKLPIDTATKKAHKPKCRWHFGIRSKCPAWEVMLEIYRSLQNVGMEWRTMDAYHLRCRYQYPTVGLVVKFDLQLYKLENNSYLVDFKNAGTQRTPEDVTDPLKAFEENLEKKFSETGDEKEDISPYLARWRVDDDVEHVQSVYPFLDVCSKLITDIV